MKNKITVTFVLILFSAFAVFAQDLDTAKLDKFFDILAQKEKAMGSLAVMKNGKIVYQRAVGFAQLENKKISTAKTKYRIGSITKMFTAAMIFQFVEKGEIKLTDTIDKFFPNLPNAKKITISNLLNHRSGLPDLLEDAEYQKYYTKPKTEAELLAMFAKYKPKFEPDAKAEYSNTNYILLGYIIEKSSGKTFGENLKSNIASKIKLADTYSGGKTDANRAEAFSYTMQNGWQKLPETDMSIPGGAGAIVSTATDLTVFADALFKKKIISENSLNQMIAIKENYGNGIFEMPVFGKKGFGHSGGIDGFNSMLIYVPEDDLAVAYISNGTAYPINDLLLGVFAIVFKKPFSLPTFETIHVKAEDLGKYAGVYASKEFPLKITVRRENDKLFAQADGQGAFPLEAFEKDKFKFDAAGIILEFNPEKNEMTLKQSGGVYVFTKEK
jgi:D-alanyl-D-alanine carboxypeptidase